MPQNAKPPALETRAARNLFVSADANNLTNRPETIEQQDIAVSGQRLCGFASPLPVEVGVAP
jgi:hypothetical protein